MSIYAGVWIDHHKAIVVLFKEGKEEIVQIDSEADKPFASTRASGSKKTERLQGYIPENKLDHKYMIQLDTYYDEVLKSLQGVESLLILGPGEAKGEFQRRLKTLKCPAEIVEVQAADKLTDRQVAAQVRQRFIE